MRLSRANNSEAEEATPADVLAKDFALGKLPKPQTSKLVLEDWLVAQRVMSRPLNLRLSRTRRKLARQLFESGYLQWPRKIEMLVKGRSVLDFGSGKGLHPLGYRVMGATHAVGYDPFITMAETEEVKSKVTGQALPLSINLGAVSGHIPSVAFTSDLAEARKFGPYDCVVLHNVTEHLPDVPGALADVRSLLSKGGLIVFHHHNFYSWDGHHAPPKLETDIDFGLGAHKDVVDWAHIDFDAPASHPIIRGTLNKITLDGLRAEVERLFSLDLWVEVPSPVGRGAGRFQHIPASVAQRFQDRDLRIKNVLGVAHRRV